MPCEFDDYIERRCTESAKWRTYGDDVLPLWVADMDFRSPQPVIDALRERLDHGVFGYPTVPAEFPEVIVERLDRRYGWRVSEEDIVFIPGCITGFNMACHAIGSRGDGVLMQPPVYGPFLSAPANANRRRVEAELTRGRDGRYTVDTDLFERSLGGRTRLFVLCNPHNPVGRVFSREELTAMAEACLRHDVVICSDEIHCELLFSGQRHIPIASLAPEIAARTITLMSPSKTFNIAGLKCAVAIVQNPELRKQFQAARQGLVPGINVMGYVAALAAYRDGQPWLDALLPYLEENRDEAARFVGAELPGVQMATPEGTYLAWLDCRQAELGENPGSFFLREARVALNDGLDFGPAGEGFVRLNFGCCRSLLQEALRRMAEALAHRRSGPRRQDPA